MSKKIFFLALTLLLIASCTQRKDVIRIGGVGPLSAPGSYETGQEMKMAMQLAAEEINSEGGLLGKTVQLIFEDTQGLPEKGTAAMERLITQGNVVAVAGEFHSSVCTAQIEVANRLNIPFVISGCYADTLTAKHYPVVFRVAPSNSYFYSKIADWIYERGFRNIAMITENTDWGLDVERVLKIKFKEHGIHYTSMIAERTIQDFTPQLLVLKKMSPRPDLILNNFTGTGEYLIIKQAKEVGLSPTTATAMFAMGIDALHPEFWETVGGAGQYVLIKNSFYPGVSFTSKTKTFLDNFERRFKRAPILPALEAHDAVMTIAKAIQKAGSTESQAIIQAMEEMNFEGLRGTISFSKEKNPEWLYHQYTDIPVLILQYTQANQDPNTSPILWPPRLKTGEFLKP